MMSAQAGFAMVRKLCKGGCVKMQARGEGSIKCKKILLPSYVHGTLSHLHIQMGACGAHEWSWWKFHGKIEEDRAAKRATQMGLEPTTFRSEVERAIHCATRPYAANLSCLPAQKGDSGEPT